MSSSLVGTILASKYRVERVLGEGGMGIVYAATHLDLDELVAIKVLHAEAAKNDDVVARFLREGRAAARIKSEHIVRVRDVGRLDDGSPFMVMELLEGKDLDALTAAGPLPVTDAIDYVLQACDALAEAHSVGIVHRDLKPSNLFLSHRRNGAPCVKVLDFGISKVQGDGLDAKRTAATDVFGSPFYMSPEQLRSTADVDARADVWALAVVLYELLTGHPIFDRPTLAMVHLAILQEPVPDVRLLRPDVPEPIAQTILSALVKDRNARTPTIAAFAAGLAPFASAVGAEAFRAITSDPSSHRMQAAAAAHDAPLGPTPPRASASTAICAL